MGTMNRRFLRTAALASIGIFTSSTAGAQDSPRRLIEAVNTASDLSQIGAYSLEASVVANPGTRDERRGRLSIQREGRNSRLELQFGNYHEIRVISGNRVCISRSVPYEPSGLSAMQSVDRSWKIDWPDPPEAKLTKVHHKNGIFCLDW